MQNSYHIPLEGMFHKKVLVLVQYDRLTEKLKKAFRVSYSQKCIFNHTHALASPLRKYLVIILLFLYPKKSYHDM